MIFSGCSTLEFFTWLIGLLVIYEVLVYVFFTYLKTPTNKNENRAWKNDFADDEETETEIERLNKLNEEAFNSIESETIEGFDEDFSDDVPDDVSLSAEFSMDEKSDDADITSEKPVKKSAISDFTKSSNEELVSFLNSVGVDSGTDVSSSKVESNLEKGDDNKIDGWPFDESNLIVFDSGEQVLFEQEGLQDKVRSENSGNPPYFGTILVDLSRKSKQEQ